LRASRLETDEKIRSVICITSTSDPNHNAKEEVMNKAQTQDKNMIETGRALALGASLGLLLGVALPAAAQNLNAQNL
jgi:hypothetical protein